MSVCLCVCLSVCAIAKHTLLGVIDTFGQRNNPYIGLGWPNKKGVFSRFIYVSVWFGSWTSLWCIMGELAGYSLFRSSVKCGAPLMENRFQVAKFLFEVWKASSLFCLVQNGPGLTWVACIGLRERSKWSLGCARSFLETFLDLL